MCRGKNDSGSRRCPCDTSEKRRLRRVNRQAFSSVEAKKASNIKEVLNKVDSTHIHDVVPQAKNYKLDGTPEENVKNLYEIAEHVGLRRWESPKQALPVVVEVGRNISEKAKEYMPYNEEDLDKEREALVKDNGELVKRSTELYSEVNRMSSELRAMDDPTEEDRARVRDRREEVRQELQATVDGLRERRIELERKDREVAQAYLRALKELRGGEFGAGEEGIVLSEHATKGQRKDAEFLAQSVDCYPRDWVDESNSSDNKMITRSASSRAHYGTKYITTDKRLSTQTAYNQVLVDEYERTPHLFQKMSKAEMKKHKIEPEMDGNGNPYPVYMKTDYTGYSSLKHGPLGEDGLPVKGNGWKKIKTTTSYFSWKTKEREEEEMELIVRTRKVYDQTSSVRLREITFPKTDEGSTEKYVLEAKSTAAHEFAHRSEEMMPAVADLERHFIRSRISETEKPVVFKGGKNPETGYSDSFNRIYTGRIYGNDFREEADSGKHYEVLSTGVESIFGTGSYVKQVDRKTGLTSTDTHMRDFCLGILATVNRKKA